MTNTNPSTAYESWSREDLIRRLTQLESGSREAPASPPPQAPKKFDFGAYETRKIALKFCYSGWEYGGLAFQNAPTPLPTVEGVLFDALAHARLVDGEAGLDGCGWERCGRTDRGVSAAGQVVSLYVRSSRRKEATSAQAQAGAASSDSASASTSGPSAVETDGDALAGFDLETSEPTNNSARKAEETHRELPYVWTLNHLLPPTIRVLAWSPIAPDFSARFNCKFRHYKYFFPCAGLSIPRMQEAAALLVGEHDFRNLCKLDPAKQIKTFKRGILSATISPVQGEDGMYVLDLVGTAFLYHQVRHIMAMLLLVGSGLEPPSVISALMNVEDNPGTELPIVDRKPEYQMADGLPLMLWDCGYADQDVDWRSNDGSLSGQGYLHTQMRSIRERSRIHTTLNQHFLQAAEKFHAPEDSKLPLGPGALVLSSASGRPFPSLPKSKSKEEKVNYSVPLGGGTFRRAAEYVPLLERKRLEHVDVVNERWLNTKGARKAARTAGADAVGADE